MGRLHRHFKTGSTRYITQSFKEHSAGQKDRVWPFYIHKVSVVVHCVTQSFSSGFLLKSNLYYKSSLNHDLTLNWKQISNELKS